MADEVWLNSFDDDAVAKLARAVHRLQAQYLNLTKAVAARSDRATDGWHLRTGITTTSPRHPSYPSTGCKFVVQFEDWDFDEVPDGRCDRETKAWSAKYVVARSYHGKYIAEGTRVLMAKVPARRGRRWIILPIPPKLDIRRFELTSDLTFGGSADAVLLDCGLVATSGIVVRDSIGEWHGLAGYQGWCVRLDDCPETIPAVYEILFLEAPARWIEFTLTADMQSQSAPASVVRYWGTSPNGKSPGNTLTVYDRGNLFRRAKSGAKGFAVYDEKHTAASPLGRWVVVQCETQAGWICFDLQDDPKQVPEPSALVVSYWGTQQDIQDPGANVTVTFCNDHFPHAMQHATGTAALDVVTGKYRVVTCDQQATACTGEPVDKFCPEDLTVPIASWDVATFWPFGQRPEITTALNLYGLAGHAGDQVWLAWSEAFDAWVIVQVSHHVVEVPIDLRYNNCRLEKYVLKTPLMYCELPEWKTAIQLVRQRYVEDIGKSITYGSGSGSGQGPVESCAISQTKSEVCVFAPGEQRATNVALEAVPREVVTLVYDDGDCVRYDTQVAFVICLGATDDGDVFCTTDCEDGGQ